MWRHVVWLNRACKKNAKIMREKDKLIEKLESKKCTYDSRDFTRGVFLCASSPIRGHLAPGARLRFPSGDSGVWLASTAHACGLPGGLPSLARHLAPPLRCQYGPTSTIREGSLISLENPLFLQVLNFFRGKSEQILVNLFVVCP